MCGIFGVIDSKQVSIEGLQRASKAMRHRGPDDEGFLLFGELSFSPRGGDDTVRSLQLPMVNQDPGEHFSGAFVHRRLSIIDLSEAGHQPMSYLNDRYWICYNGEVYNYRELRAELESIGCSFRTASDTEVILAAFHTWGSDCVKRFNGMWAFAIWDRKTDRLFLSRDRFGIKPLYYSVGPDGLLFASEIKALKAYRDSGWNINENQVHRYLVKGYVDWGSQETIYNEVSQLMPGHSLEYHQGRSEINRYWRLEETKNTCSAEENIGRFREAFKQSVNLRLRSDVPVGACLSGGLDSSSIVTEASAQLDHPMHTFSAIWPGDACDESTFVQVVNQKFACKDHMFTPSLENLQQVIDKEVYHQEMPLGGSSLLAQWFVMESASNAQIKVLLDGQGADEVLGGYPRYVPSYFYELFFKPSWLELLRQRGDFQMSGYGIKEMLRWLQFRQQSQLVPVLPIGEKFLASHDSRRDIRSSFHFDRLADHQRFELELSCLPHLLHIEDRNSMAHSIESRVPYLDYQLVELAFSIPAEQKIHGGLTKVVLREAMRKTLPSEVYERRDKIGFATPIERKLFDTESELSKACFDSLKQSALWNSGWLDTKAIEANKVELFRLYSLSRFIELWA